jgi:hypothetical protein
VGPPGTGTTAKPWNGVPMPWARRDPAMDGGPRKTDRSLRGEKEVTKLMLRFLLRFFSLCLLAAAFITFIIDARRSYAVAMVSFTPLSDLFTLLAPSKWALAQEFIDRHARPMQAMTAEFVSLPVWLGFAVAGGLFRWLGKRPARKFGFSSR